MKRIYSSNVPVGSSGAIGAPAEASSSAALLLSRPAQGLATGGKQRGTYDYATSAHNYATKVQEPAHISRGALNQYQNRNKSLLQYKHQFDKMRGFRGQYGSTRPQGFKGFGRPLGSEALAAAGDDRTGKVDKAAKAGAASKTQEIAERMKGRAVGQVAQLRPKSQSRT